jgi:hypothetical protein
MAFETVVVSWDETDVTQTALGGAITFQISAPLVDGATGQVAQSSPPTTCYFVGGAGTSPSLVANDSPGAEPTTTDYTVTVAISGQQPYSFTTLINHANGSAQTLGYLQANAT